MLMELFSFEPNSVGYQADERTLRELLEEQVRIAGRKLDGNARLYIARAFSMVMAARKGADVATIAGAV